MQPLLFDALPMTEPIRRAGRRAPRAEASRSEIPGSDRPRSMPAQVAVEVLRDKPVPVRDSGNSCASDGVDIADNLFTAPQVRIVYQPAPFDPAALTNPELRALVQAISDQRLAHLLVEASRELKRRVAPDNDGGIESFDSDANDCADGHFEPNPLLLRAARQAAGELSGDDD